MTNANVTVRIVKTELKEFEVIVDTGVSTCVYGANWNKQNAFSIACAAESEFKSLGFDVTRDASFNNRHEVV